MLSHGSAHSKINSFDSMRDYMHNKAERKIFMPKNIKPYVSNSTANLSYKACLRLIMKYEDFLLDSRNRSIGETGLKRGH